MTRKWVIASTWILGSVGFGLGCSGVGTLQYESSGQGGSGSGATAGVGGATAAVTGTGNATNATNAATTGTGSSSSGGATGLPCDLAAVFTTCIGCHTHPTVGGAVGSLVTYADLMSPAPADPSKTMAQMALQRMQSTSAPMPPAGFPRETAAQIKTLSDWLAAGEPKGTCGGTTSSTTGASTSGTTSSGATTSSASTTSSTSSGGTMGIPCNVAPAFAVCGQCHGHPTRQGAIGSLVTYADLVGPAPNSSQTMAQMALAQLQAGSMPPAGFTPDTPAQIKAVSDWVAAGTPMGATCGTGMDMDAGMPPPPDPTFTGPSTCASGQYFQGSEGATMNPGQACIKCHASQGGEAPHFTIAGTVFPTGHVPDRCLPTSAQSADLTQAQVIITDKNNKVTTLTVNSNGNFSSMTSINFPFTAKVVYQGRTRAMSTPQSTGDCNGCHTDAGLNGAPGRIALP